MIDVAIDLLMNLALLVALTLVSLFLTKLRPRGRRADLLQGLLFGAASLLAMTRPMVFSPGIIFDGRSVMISVCAFYFGPAPGAVAAAMAAAYRVLLGGGGTLTGVLVVLSSFLAGAVLRRRRRSASLPDGREFIRLGLLVHVAMLLLMLTLPGGAGPDVLLRIGLPVLLTYPLVTLLIGRILVANLVGIRTLEALRQTEEILSRFIRNSPIYAFVKEVKPGESRVLHASENYLDMIGVAGSDMVGRTMAELFPADFAAKITADDWAVASSGRVLKLDEELNGRHYNTIKFPIRVADRVLLAGYTIDVSERRRSEADLADKELRLRTLLASIPDLVWLKDAEGRYLFCNPMFARCMGVRAEDLVGRSDHDFMGREKADRFRDDDRRAVAAGSPVRIEETVTFADDGHPAILETTKTPVFNADGTLMGLLGISRDISERRRLEAQLVQSQKMESIGSLAGGVAHDMNNVLAAILGLASANLEFHAEGSPARRAFDTIIKASERGGKMVRTLLSFARQSLAEERELDLNAILREDVGLLERTTLARVQLELDLEPALHPVLGDAPALAHAVMNLCVNAVDAMPGGGTLTLRSRNLGEGRVEVAVEDTGHGMTPEVLAKAIDPYFTTKEQGKGTGLGLSLVYTTVKAHRGEMEIRSEPGRGTRVLLRFPALRAAAPDLPADDAAPARSLLSSLAVLLIDDDELIRNSLGDMLRVLGHTPLTAASGEEALALLAGGAQPDVAILDMNMPGLGGAGTLPRLREMRPALAVLLATGRADQPALELIERTPGVTLLEKPFGLKDLQRRLEEAAARG